MDVDGRVFAKSLSNALNFCGPRSEWVRFTLVGDNLQLMACDPYAIGTDYVPVASAGDWPKTSLFLCKEYAKQLEQASRLAGGRGKERGYYQLDPAASDEDGPLFEEPDEEQAWFSRQADFALGSAYQSRAKPPEWPTNVAFLPKHLVKLCRVRRHDSLPEVMDVRIGDPTLVRIGTFVGLIKPISREVYAENQDEAGLWAA